MSKKVTTKTVVVPVQDPAHPKHSKWQIALQALTAAIAIGPVAVQMFDPGDAALAQGSAALASAALGAVNKAKKK